MFVFTVDRNIPQLVSTVTMCFLFSDISVDVCSHKEKGEHLEGDSQQSPSILQLLVNESQHVTNLNLFY